MYTVEDLERENEANRVDRVTIIIEYRVTLAHIL